MTRTKIFEYKGQMINYYNKVRKNDKVKFCVCGLDVEKGYYVSYRF